MYYQRNMYEDITLIIIIDLIIVWFFVYFIRLLYERNRNIEQDEELNII